MGSGTLPRPTTGGHGASDSLRKGNSLRNGAARGTHCPAASLLIATTWTHSRPRPPPATCGPHATDAASPGQAALDACWNEHEVRLQLVVGGHETPEVLFGPLARRRRGDLALGGDPADLIPVLESYWQMAAVLERLTAERVAAGVRQSRSPMGTRRRDHRLEAEIWLAEARTRPGKLLPLQGAMQDRFTADHDPFDRLWLQLSRDLAHLKHQTAREAIPSTSTNRGDQAILAEYSVRVEPRARRRKPPMKAKPPRAGFWPRTSPWPGRPSVCPPWSAISHVKWELEVLTKGRVEAGVRSFTPTNYYQTRYARLAAELLLAEACAAKK